jgi:hypothetical protein
MEKLTGLKVITLLILFKIKPMGHQEFPVLLELHCSSDHFGALGLVKHI